MRERTCRASAHQTRTPGHLATRASHLASSIFKTYAHALALICAPLAAAELFGLYVSAVKRCIAFKESLSVNEKRERRIFLKKIMQQVQKREFAFILLIIRFRRNKSTSYHTTLKILPSLPQKMDRQVIIYLKFV